MSDSKGSWTNEVDFDIPLFQYPHHEGDSMLQSTSTPKNFSTSTTPELPFLDPPTHLPTLPRPAKQYSSYMQGPLTHEASSSASPPTLMDSTTVRNPTPDLTFSSSGNGGTFNPRSQRTTVSSIKSFASSPLKPTGPTTFPLSPFNRSGSRGSAHVNRIASEECRALASHQSISPSGSRGSMILYRCADPATEDGLIPPTRSHLHRNSILSISADSIVSLSSDSKYPARTIASDRGLIAYAYDPSLDELGSATPADDDYLHEPDDKFPQQPGFFPAVSFRGVINVLALVALIAAILCLFVVYPVVRFFHDNRRNLLITLNTRINSTGQADMVVLGRRSQILFASPIPLIDSSTPPPARILKTAQDIIYELVFSDEFRRNGRSLSADQDTRWEASSSSTSNVNDPSQIEVQECRKSRSGTHVRNSGLRRGNWRGEYREKERTRMYTDMSSSGTLEMKLPLCLGGGGFVEVGLGKKRVGFDSWLRSRSGRRGDEKEEENEGVLRRLVYWPGSSDSWSSLNQSETPNIPTQVLSSLLTSDSDSGTSLTLSIGIPIDDSGRTRRVAVGSSDAGSGSEPWVLEDLIMTKRVEVEVDYVRIYQPIKSSSSVAVSGPDVGTEAEWECAAMRDEHVVLNLFDV